MDVVFWGGSEAASVSFVPKASNADLPMFSAQKNEKRPPRPPSMRKIMGIELLRPSEEVCFFKGVYIQWGLIGNNMP